MAGHAVDSQPKGALNMQGADANDADLPASALNMQGADGAETTPSPPHTMHQHAHTMQQHRHTMQQDRLQPRAPRPQKLPFKCWRLRGHKSTLMCLVV